MKLSVPALSCSLIAIALATTSGLPGATPKPAMPAANFAPAKACGVIPPIDPNKDFVGNFLNSCYAVQMSHSNGNAQVGDLNATYNEMYYQILRGLLPSGYSLIIFDNYPNTRFMSATAYDDHVVIVGQMVDNQILPLNNTMINPLLPGVAYVPNQQYGITVNLGFGAPVAVNAGCSTADTTIDQNVMDASMIHSGLTWKGDPNLPPGFPPHETGPNDGGVLEVRKYVDISKPPSTAVVVVRDLSTGCAVPASQVTSMNILAPTQPNPTTWLHEGQMQNHQTYAETIQPKYCYPPDPLNRVTWMRTRQYIPIDNGANASVQAHMAPGYVQALAAGQGFMQIQFHLPTHPTTPCADGNCVLTGNEQQRYKSLSFQDAKNTLLSLKDSDMITDPNGNVTLIVSLGAVPPPQVNAANYYTYIDLTTNPNYAQLQSLFVRDILPNADFVCSGWNVPYKTMTFNPEGGWMGTYNMTVGFVNASQIPTTPVPPDRTDNCQAAPPPPAQTIACPAAAPAQ